MRKILLQGHVIPLEDCSTITSQNEQNENVEMVNPSEVSKNQIHYITAIFIISLILYNLVLLIYFTFIIEIVTVFLPDGFCR